MPTLLSPGRATPDKAHRCHEVTKQEGKCTSGIVRLRTREGETLLPATPEDCKTCSLKNSKVASSSMHLP